MRAIVRSEDGKFLLVRHTYTPGWHFPGGGVERGETSEVALSKELYQETGLEVIDRPLLHGAFYNKRVSKRDHVLVYRCSVRDESSLQKNSREIADVGFFDASDLPDGTDPGTMRRIEEILTKSDLKLHW
ncbi:MAG: NUDIX domain-containing protein [Paracoccaceae bacterium]|nr:NUDIX domain-containing protein [Paracoccaceae bacterium]